MEFTQAYMIKKRFKYVFTNKLRKLIVNTLTALGLIWLLIEPTSFFIEPFNKFTSKNHYIFILIIIVSLFYGVIKSLPKIKVSKQFKNLGTTVKIEIGELLEKDGNLIIGSSDYFDTSTSNTNSIKTQLISKYFKGAVNNLDSQIDSSLEEQNLLGIENTSKTIGKSNKFDIGSTAVINIPSNEKIQVFLSVICKVVYIRSKKTKQSDYKMLNLALENIWTTIKNKNNNKDIYTPILGAGLTGLSFSKLTLSQLIITSFLLDSKSTKIGKSLTIVIPERNYSPEIFERLDDFIHSFEV